MSSTVVRVDRDVHSRLRQIAESEHRSIGQVVGDLVDRYEHETFWKQMHEGFASLRQDATAWKAYQDEVALWDSTLSDGLEEEEPYYTAEEEEEINAAFAQTEEW